MAIRKVRVVALDALLRPNAHVEVVALLITGANGAAHRVVDGGEILRTASVARTDVDGQAVLELEPNADDVLYPDGTYYEVRVKGANVCWTIAVPDDDGPVVDLDENDDPGPADGAWDVGDPDIQVLTPVPPEWVPVAGPAGPAGPEPTVAAGTPPFLDASTVSARFDTIMSGASLSGDDVDTEKAIVTGALVTDATDTVEGRLANSAALHQWAEIGKIQQDRRLDDLEVDVAAIDSTQGARLAVTRWAEANPQAGRYLEVCGAADHDGRAFIGDTALTFTTGCDVRATVQAPDPTTLNRWLEVLTRTADGLGSWDAYELALWIDSDGELRVFHEHTRTGGGAEVSPFADGPGPLVGVPVRIRQTTVFATGVTNIYVATPDDGDVITSDGERWLLVGTATDPAASTSFAASAYPWMIGAGGSDVGEHLRIYALEVRSSVDGTVISRPDIAGTADAAQVVLDDVLESSPGTPAEWDATAGDGVVVVPAAATGLPAVGSNGDVLTVVTGEWAAATPAAAPAVPDRIWISPNAMSLDGGAALATLGGTYHKAQFVAMDAASQERCYGICTIPTNWSAVTIRLWWTNPLSTSGDVRWECRTQRWLPATIFGDANGTTHAALTATAPTTSATMTYTDLATAVSVAAGPLYVRLDRLGANAADTLGGDAYVGMFEIIRTN